jgi:DNA polymerase I-like protein with 3'-5' exonuclease and polymerase domains
LESFQTLPEWVKLEHQVQEILTQQEIHGWQFDEVAAWQLTSTLRQELSDTEKLLRRKHPYVAGAEFTPKRNNGPQGYVTGASFTRLKELNPTSRDHISWILQTYYGWKPTQMTATGKPIVDEVILTDIGSPIAMEFLKCLTVTKMLGQISEGTNAWLKLVTNEGRIHHHCSVATNTHRCAHRNPNLAQVNSDERFRRLFVPSKGLTMVGADLSGIELRMLAHYLARYDGGRYAEILLNGDIHQTNADKIGITRKQVKTVTYAFLYGAGDEKIGHSYDSSLPTSTAKTKGREIRSAYVEAVEGLGDLLDAIKKASEKGFVKSIDGRKINVDSPHKALNYLLQSGAGVIAKRWMVINQEQIKELQLCCSQLAFVHDELQFEVDPKHAEDLCSSLKLAAVRAGEYYNMRIRIDAEAVEGNNWSTTH